MEFSTPPLTDVTPSGSLSARDSLGEPSPGTSLFSAIARLPFYASRAEPKTSLVAPISAQVGVASQQRPSCSVPRQSGEVPKLRLHVMSRRRRGNVSAQFALVPPQRGSASAMHARGEGAILKNETRQIVTGLVVVSRTDGTVILRRDVEARQNPRLCARSWLLARWYRPLLLRPRTTLCLHRAGTSPDCSCS